MKGQFMKRIVIGIVIFLLTFTIYHSYMFYKLGIEPSTLITCVFSACSVEAIALMYKKLKGDVENEPNKRNDYNDVTEHICTTSECDCGASEEYISTGPDPDESSSVTAKPGFCKSILLHIFRLR